MTEMEKVFMKRDRETAREAREHRQGLMEDFYQMIESGCDYDDIEDLLYNEGLEMDYIFDLM